MFKSLYDKIVSQISAADIEADTRDAAVRLATAVLMVSVHEFTQLLHKHLSHDEKTRVVQLLWSIAYADGELDKYEDSLVLKISDLLHVSRGRVMRLKHDAQRIM